MHYSNLLETGLMCEVFAQNISYNCTVLM